MMHQEMNPDRSFSYRVESASHFLGGRFINRALMMQSQIKFEDFGAYTETLVAQLIDAVAQSALSLDSAVTVQFLGRTVSDVVLHPAPEKLQLDWIRMMTRYLFRLRTLAPEHYIQALATTIVRFYSQAGHDSAWWRRWLN
ncbi:hypothetical protein [Lacticaseibacillus camelliae]|uniref:hypothetical protein n=1 Tax=Lacticaseibacillus camelliae TaxID=381742 RepID=UPI0012E28C38|nr:hypothetical protein [Lacticaseibacillus camelliae]